MGVISTTREARATLRAIVGLRLTGSRNFCATRQFYFGDATSHNQSERLHYTLGVECPWRIQKTGKIIVGSEDYYEKGDQNADPRWEPGMPGGHLQDEKLAELLGTLREGDIVNTRSGFIVEAAELDRCGGIRIELGRGHIFEIFPTSAKSMEWILRPPKGPSLVLIEGGVVKTKSRKRLGVNG